MTTVKTWLASAALVGGAGAGAAAGLAAVDGGTQPAAAARPVAAGPDTGYLNGQIDALLREDRALKVAVHRARQRLAGEVHAGERSLAALHRRIVTAQNELAMAQAQAARARAAGVAATTVTYAPPSAPPPVAHTTTGASGAGTASDDDGGSDDGAGDD